MKNKPKTLHDLRDEMRAVARGDARPALPSSETAYDLVSSRLATDLVKAIADHRPSSVGELAELVGRPQSNVSRLLQKMARAGMVSLVRDGRTTRPEVRTVCFLVDIDKRTAEPVAVPAD